MNNTTITAKETLALINEYQAKLATKAAEAWRSDDPLYAFCIQKKLTDSHKDFIDSVRSMSISVAGEAMADASREKYDAVSPAVLKTELESYKQQLKAKQAQVDEECDTLAQEICVSLLGVMRNDPETSNFVQQLEDALAASRSS